MCLELQNLQSFGRINSSLVQLLNFYNFPSSLHQWRFKFSNQENCTSAHGLLIRFFYERNCLWWKQWEEEVGPCYMHVTTISSNSWSGRRNEPKMRNQEIRIKVCRYKKIQECILEELSISRKNKKEKHHQWGNEANYVQCRKSSILYTALVCS